jgi:hypothetical protein
MRTRYRIILAGAIAMTAVLASRLDLPHRSSAALPPDRVIVRLEGRDDTITVTSSPTGPRYSLALDGQLVADRITLDEMRVQYPDAYGRVSGATAGTTGTAPTIWAGVDTGE